MAQRYTIIKNFDLQNPDDPQDVQFSEQIDLAVELSKRLQRNVRQGHVFKIHKVQMGLVPRGGDLDLGMSTVLQLKWAPATKNSVKAWQIAYNTWRKQKALRIGAIGQGVRYDDFEIAYDSSFINSRTSALFAGGLDDPDNENVTIYGNSTEGSDITLQDLYESLQPQSLPSRFPIGNAVVKESKFTAEFPTVRKIVAGANWSTILPTDFAQPDTGAAYNADPIYIEDKNCLAGIVIADGWVLAEDTAGSIADILSLQVAITVEIGTSLLPSKKPRRKTMRKPRAKKSTKRTSRKRG